MHTSCACSAFVFVRSVANGASAVHAFSVQLSSMVSCLTSRIVAGSKTQLIWSRSKFRMDWYTRLAPYFCSSKIMSVAESPVPTTTTFFPR